MCLKLEMANTIKFYKEEQEKILLSSAIYNGDSLWERGAVIIPNKELKILTKTISQLVASFSPDGCYLLYSNSNAWLSTYMQLWSLPPWDKYATNDMICGINVQWGTFATNAIIC